MAARFFYCAKASKSERDAGLAGREAGGGVRSNAPRASEEVKTRARLNTHPTVKPLELMKWLCRLATPPGGVVLDPFLGSGSTALAALAEGFRFVGVEKEEEYLQIARARIEAALLAEREGPPKKAKGAPRARKPKAEAATAEAPQDAPEATP
jgi:site-specific DNA-methyltransferase (adenine-specific)